MADYIEREALYRKIAKMEEVARNWVIDTPFSSPAYQRYSSQYGERAEMKHLVERFPAADVEPVRHGRWIKDSGFIICACCESEIEERNRVGELNARNFCPNCGAKMDGED